MIDFFLHFFFKIAFFFSFFFCFLISGSRFIHLQNFRVNQPSQDYTLQISNPRVEFRFRTFSTANTLRVICQTSFFPCRIQRVQRRSTIMLKMKRLNLQNLSISFESEMTDLQRQGKGIRNGNNLFYFSGVGFCFIHSFFSLHLFS